MEKMTVKWEKFASIFLKKINPICHLISADLPYCLPYSYCKSHRDVAYLFTSFKTARNNPEKYNTVKRQQNLSHNSDLVTKVY